MGDNMESNPELVYFLIAEYNDDSALPQFDPETYRENLFRDIDKSKLKAFGWYPFSEEFAKKLRENGVKAVSKPLPYFRLVLKDGWRLIAFRRTAVKYGLTKQGDITNQRIKVLFYALGFQTTVRGRNVKCILWINDNGNVVISENDEWMKEL